MSRYMIHCCAGTGGLFLTSVFSKIMGNNLYPKFSDTGNCHDLGHGAWKGAPGANFLGNHWEINYKPNCPLYYAHQVPLTFRNSNPDIKFVFIDVDPEDYLKVTMLYVKKAWPDLWTQQEYNKWKGPDYPLYSKNNIAESDLIVQDLVGNLLVTHIEPWFKNNQPQSCDYSINFKTIMGLNDLVLDQVVSDIVQRPTTTEIHQFVSDYQTLNQRLYWQT